MAATATTDDLLVSQPDVSLLFMCRRSDLRLVRIPRYDMIGAGGQRSIGGQPGQAVAFSEGIFRCPPTGTVKLEDGRPADAEEIVEWLEGHHLFGNVEEGFWRVDPTAPPVSEAELQALMDAAMNFDVEALERIVAQERDGWGREAVVNQAEQALEKIRAYEAELKAQQAAEQETPAEPKPEPKKK